jgi:hypothetical protein
MSHSLKALRTTPHPAGPARSPRRRNGKQKAEAAALEAQLLELQQGCQSPVLYGILEETISQLHKIATRDARRIRDEVFEAIDVHGCRHIEEIVDEVKLTRWVVEGVVKELAELELVELREEPEHRREPGSGAPRLEVYPRHTPPGGDFLMHPARA